MINKELAVPRMKCPSLESFNTNYLLPLKPVVLEGIIDHWPALNEHLWRFVLVLLKSTLCISSVSILHVCPDDIVMFYEHIFHS